MIRHSNFVIRNSEGTRQLIPRKKRPLQCASEGSLFHKTHGQLRSFFNRISQMPSRVSGLRAPAKSLALPHVGVPLESDRNGAANLRTRQSSPVASHERLCAQTRATAVGLLESPGSLCTGVGVAGMRQEVGAFFGCGCHDRGRSELPFPAAGFRRRALFRKSPRASCPALIRFPGRQHRHV